MEQMLTFGESIIVAVEVGMLVALWGIYTEVRKSVEKDSN